MANQTLDFTPTKNADGTVSWSLCIKGGACGTGTDPFPAVYVHHGNADVKFDANIVNDQTGMGIKFAPTNPIWVQQGAKPTGPGVDTQIYDISNSVPTTLKFTDANCNHGDVVLKYQLNFVDSGGNPVTPVDPDIHNGGSGAYVANLTNIAAYTPAQWTALAIAFAIGFAVAALIFRRAARKG